MKKGFIAAVPAAILAVLSLACSETGGLGLDLGTTCDHLVTATVVDANLRTERDCPTALDLIVTVNVTPLDGSGGGTALSDFRLSHYIVSYVNQTGVGSASTAPATYDDTIGTVIPGGSGGAVVLVELLREAAKTAFPLDDDGYYGANPEGGVEIEATIQFWGYPVGQPDRECVGFLVQEFTVYDAVDGSQREMDECDDEMTGG